MKQVLLLSFFALFMAATPAAAKTLSKVAAVVNTEMISTFQLDRALAATLGKNPNRNQLTATQYEQMRMQILKNLINEKLLQQQIEELGLRVAAVELDSAIEDVRLKNGLTEQALEQALLAQGLSMSEYREQIRAEILRFKLLSREVNYKVLVTSSEVRNHFNANLDQYRIEPRIRLNQISFEMPLDSEEQLTELQQQVDISRALLLDGEEFKTVLAAQGDLATGGYMGELVEADLAEPLQLALAGLLVGEVSQPVELNGQLHLFQVIERTAAAGDLFDLVKAEIEETLKRDKTDQRFEEWHIELRENARVEIRI